MTVPAGDTVALRTDAALLEDILARGFDPDLPVGREAFLRLIATAERIDPNDLPPEVAEMTPQFGATGAVLALPTAIGAVWLDALLANVRVSLTPNARHDALRGLVRRLVPVLQQTVRLEEMVARSARAFGGATDTPPDDRPLLEPWLDRWRLYPVLASLVTLTLVHWERAFAEMFRALDNDVDDIVRLAGGDGPLRVSAIAADAGDLHLGGRAVMLLTFEGGSRIVFKPKRLAVTDVFREVVACLNAAGFTPPLRVHDAIVRERHAWEAFVPHRTCTDEAQVQRFYRRMGGWIRLLQTLDGRDFWLDNLVADGEFPVFIDLETVLQPRRAAAAPDGAAARVQRRLDDSPLATDIVSLPTPIGPDVGAENLGCFAPPRPYLSPFPAVALPGVAEERPAHGYRVWTHPEHAPLLHGEPVDAAAWYPEIEAGYREMAAAIDAAAPEVLVPGGIVDRICEHPVRTIHRDTWTCVKIVQRSVAPPLLGSWRRRHDWVGTMARPVGDESGDVVARVVAAEQRAILALDVPFFTTTGASDAIHPPDDAPIPGLFDGTVRDRLRHRLAHPDPAELAHDIAVLRTLFAQAHPETPPIPGAAPLVGEVPSDPVALAEGIGRDILAASVTGDDGSRDWPALTYFPAVDIETLAPLAADLLSGRAGLLVFALDLWRATGDAAWRRWAEGLAGDLAGAVDEALRRWRDAAGTPAAATPILGAFVGVGGMLAALRLAADVLGAAPLRASWDRALADPIWTGVPSAAPRDVVGGTIGLGLALTASPAWIPDLPDALRARLVAAATATDAAVVPMSPGATARLAGIPGEAAGRVLLAHRLGLPWEPDAVYAVLKPASGDLPGIGDLLALVAMTERWDPWELPILLNADDAIDAAIGPGTRQEAHIAAVELALALWHLTRRDRWLGRASGIVAPWVEAHGATGSWFADDLADERFRLSAVWGLPAVARVLLRLGGAPAVRSIRALDLRSWER